MKTDNRLGTFEQIADLFPADSARIAYAIRDLLISLDQQVFEVPRLGEKTTTYGVGPSKMKQAYCYIMPQKSYVNLGFFHGANLPDRDKLLEGTGKSIRHIKIRSFEDLARPEILAMITDAIEDRKRNEKGIK